MLGMIGLACLCPVTCCVVLVVVVVRRRALLLPCFVDWWFLCWLDDCPDLPDRLEVGEPRGETEFPKLVRVPEIVPVPLLSKSRLPLRERDMTERYHDAIGFFMRLTLFLARSDSPGR